MIGSHQDGRLLVDNAHYKQRSTEKVKTICWLDTMKSVTVNRFSKVSPENSGIKKFRNDLNHVTIANTIQFGLYKYSFKV